MSQNSGPFETLQRYGSLLVAKVLSRDNLHLGPRYISPAIAGRLRSGLRALEAYARRLILFIALALEHELTPSTREYGVYQRQKRRVPKSPSFPVFVGERVPPEINFGEGIRRSPERFGRGAEIIAAPLLQRLFDLKALIAAPEARARQIAFQLARRRPGPLLAPHNGRGRSLVPPRLGTEISSLYDSMAHSIHMTSRKRPKHIGPAIRAGPRIRRL
jgi:hypothetical protein